MFHKPVPVARRSEHTILPCRVFMRQPFTADVPAFSRTLKPIPYHGLAGSLRDLGSAPRRAEFHLLRVERVREADGHPHGVSVHSEVRFVHSDQDARQAPSILNKRSHLTNSLGFSSYPGFQRQFCTREIRTQGRLCGPPHHSGMALLDPLDGRLPNAQRDRHLDFKLFARCWFASGHGRGRLEGSR